MSLHSGHQVVYFAKEDEEKFLEKFRGYKDGVVKLIPDGWFYSTSFGKLANKYYDFKLQHDDVIIMTYPKCGTTWTMETVWTMRNNPNFDNPEAKTDYNFRTPFLEFDFMMECHKTSRYSTDEFMNEARRRCPGKDVTNDNVFFEITDSLPNPRTIKTHLPLTLMPNDILDTCKVVYVIRHPKDVALSFYHHHKLLKIHAFTGNFDEFIDFFVKDEILCGPFWVHIQEAWNKRHHPNLFISFYEKIKENPIKEYKRLNDFLGTHLSIDQLEKIVEHTSFTKMQLQSHEGESTSPFESDEAFIDSKYAQENGGFFRKGLAGGWKSDMTKEQSEKMDKWINLNLKNMDGEFHDIFNSL